MRRLGVGNSWCREQRWQEDRVSTERWVLTRDSEGVGSRQIFSFERENDFKGLELVSCVAYLHNDLEPFGHNK